MGRDKVNMDCTRCGQIVEGRSWCRDCGKAGKATSPFRVRRVVARKKTNMTHNPHRVGRAYEFEEMLVTRLVRVPPTWSVERLNAEGEVEVLRLTKAATGTPTAFLWGVMGSGHMSFHGTRKGALRQCRDAVLIAEEAA